MIVNLPAIRNAFATAVLTSNPYRAATAAAAVGEPTMGWTRSKADNGGRVIEVQTFAGAGLPAPWAGNTASTGMVATAYAGTYTTVTDQAGRVRRSKIDALGRLIRVDEPSDANNTLGDQENPTQPTIYQYDPLGNLTQVIQGAQITNGVQVTPGVQNRYLAIQAFRG
jgi:YD repeat-containing protein